MALIIEDGSQVSGANSYVTLAQVRAYGLSRGVALSEADATLEAQVIESMDYLESFADRFKGELVARDQPLSWPRIGAYIEGWNWTSVEIPRQVLNAVYSLVLEVHAGEDLFNPTAAALPAIKKRVEGAVAVEYANPGQSLKVKKTQKSRTHILLLLRNSGLSAVRT